MKHPSDSASAIEREVAADSLRRGSARSPHALDDTRAAYLLLAPFLIFFVFFILYPVLQNLYYSFTNYNLTNAPKWAGLKNYARLFKDDVFQKAVLNTAWYALISVLGLAVFGMLAAVALNGPMRWIRGVRLLCLYPYATSMTAVSMIWLLLLDPMNGYANKLLSLFGLAGESWLFDTDLALGCLIFINIWKNVGYCMLILLAGLQRLDASLFEAARVDGAGSWQQFIHITLPGIMPVIQFVLVTSGVESFKTFEQVQIMTRGDPLYSTTTIVHQIYQRGFGEYKMGYAAAMSVVLLIIIAIFTAINIRLTAREGE